jgi:multicomponent Na+:H+ antiporter subunit D
MNILPLFVVIPLGTAFIISLSGKYSKRIGDILSNAACLGLLILSIYAIAIINRVPNNTLVYNVGGWIPPIGICMVLDGLSSLLLVTLSLVSLLVSLYSVNYMEKYTAKNRFYCLFMLMLAGMNGVIITGDMFNLFVFLEIASIASYALVAFGTEAEELEASFKYGVMGSVASSFILLGIALLYSYTSTLNMADISLALSQKGANNIIAFVSVLFLMGFGLKSAIVPFHAWLPDAHPSAPAPISAMLSGLLIKSLGIYALCRVFFNVLGVSGVMLNLLVVLGLISMTVGAFLAIGQDDIKRMLAYSSISQIGYILLGLGLASPLGILGAMFHLINHAIFKSLLFLNAGAIEYSLKTRSLKKMGGLRSKMPVTAATSLIGSMSISGIPPLSGFWSKLIIILACIQGRQFIAATIAILISIITLAYYLKLQTYAFFGDLKTKESVQEVPFFMRFSMVVLAILSIIGGIILIPDISNIFINLASDVILSGKFYSSLVWGAIR